MPYPRRTFIAPLIRGGEVLLRRAVTLVGAERELTGESLFSLSLSLSPSPLSPFRFSPRFFYLSVPFHTRTMRESTLSRKRKRKMERPVFFTRAFFGYFRRVEGRGERESIEEGKVYRISKIFEIDKTR